MKECVIKMKWWFGKGVKSLFVVAFGVFLGVGLSRFCKEKNKNFINRRIFKMELLLV